MINYDIDPSDITSLTEPMFTACGIECPAMIGAPCPGNTSGRYMDGPADARHYASRCPGHSSKFPSAAAEVVYGWTLSNFQDEDCGGENGETWFALFRTPDDERHDNNPMGAGVILCALSSGAVQVTRFDSAEELSRDWAKIVAEYEDDDPQVCEDFCGLHVSHEPPCKES